MGEDGENLLSSPCCGDLCLEYLLFQAKMGMRYLFIRREWKKYPGGGMGFRGPGLGALPPQPPGAGGPDQPLGEPACFHSAPEEARFQVCPTCFLGAAP